MKIGEILTKAYEVLKKEGIDTYILDSQLLLQKVIKKDKMFIILNRSLEIDEKSQEEFFRLLELRKNKMPVKYILGECEFMGMNFNVREGVLIPRGDTEILVEEAIKEINHKKYTNICDVCCGSGAIGISIGKYIEDTNVTCFDISDTACEVTEENIHKFDLQDRVKVINSDLLKEAINQGLVFHGIFSNPPYIRKDVIPTLMEDVKNYEPYIALCGGEDGMDFYKEITKQSLKVLKSGGILGYEIGHDQREAVEEILRENNFINIRTIKDLAGLDRVVLGNKK